MIVHDLRSPLAGIRAYLDLLKLDGAGKLDSELTESIDAARKVAVEMTDMVSDLLDVSRMEVGKMPLELAPADVGALAVDAVAAAGAAPRVRIRVETTADTLRVVCDAGIVRRVIANLVGNAVKFTPVSGQITVIVRGDGAEVKVSVVDTGPGIPPEYHQKVFDKFGQVEAARHGAKHSSGLGLTFCKFAVEAHGGRIGLESAAGKGSTFWLVLPARGPAMTSRAS